MLQAKKKKKKEREKKGEEKKKLNKVKILYEYKSDLSGEERGEEETVWSCEM